MELPLWRTDMENMAYVIRDEGIEPFDWVINMGYSKETIMAAQSVFVSELKDIIEKLYKNANIHVVKLDEQLNRGYSQVENCRTISIDTYFKGTYNLEITRLFKVVNGKTEFIKLTHREGFDTIEEQIKRIEQGNYIIVDDDEVGGRTIRNISQQLEKYGIHITGKLLLMDLHRDEHTEPILDVVDTRDFIFGASGGGLTVQARNGSVLRVPYILPLVDITDKANIPESNKIEASIKLWEMNIKFWGSIDSKITVDKLGKHTEKIMRRFGIYGNTPVIEAFQIAKKFSTRYNTIISI